MALRYFGKDPESDTKGSPTVFVDEVTADLVIQGWKASEETLTACREVGTIPDHEAVVRVPARMVKILREACNDAERTQLR